MHPDDHGGLEGYADLADAILREFRLQPVAVGRVDAETGEVKPNV